MAEYLQVGPHKLAYVKRPIRLGGRTIWLRMVPDSAGALEMVTSIRGLSEKRWPYWLEQWPATFALGLFLENHWPDIAGRSGMMQEGLMLDLGCGTGFLSLTLQDKGHRLIACDFNEDACRIARHNLGRLRPAPEVLCADMEQYPSRLRFDLIVAGELLYARDNLPKVLSFLGRHLERTGLALVGDPGRASAAGFPEMARSSGFACITHRQVREGLKRPAEIFELRWDA